jgi:hypothetical protein
MGVRWYSPTHQVRLSSDKPAVLLVAQSYRLPDEARAPAFISKRLGRAVLAAILKPEVW